MSVRVMSEVFRRSQATLGARLVLLAIADAAGDDGIAWPGNENLAEKALMADSSVRRCVKDIAESGELEVRQTRIGRSTINVYRVTLGDLEEPNLKRMPREVADLFAAPPTLGSPPADPERVNGDAHPPILSSSPADPEQPGASGVLRGKEEPLGNRPNDDADPLAAPPPIVKVDGRDVPFDALAEVCEIRDGSPRLTQVGLALNGPKGQPRLGLRRIYWGELLRWAEGNERRLEHLRAMHTHPDVFADYLARAIRRRGDAFRERMPGVTFGPQKLRDWFLDLEPVGTPPDHDGETAGFDWGDAR